MDSKSKVILKYSVTGASVRDSQALGGLLDAKDEGQDLHADSAYVGKKQEKNNLGQQNEGQNHRKNGIETGR